ncbi:asparaginase [Wenjunlia vitaminophila]|uniref:Asparaginase n=2 Tax=Wenjunlia vitaminophila TaxID=76728 RepID=A0A0T6LYE9_WENVI|nr:asparaginase [Wenjunlia vitaminophila]KRV51191.1 asparaginase [Wenjunlia vitaminophila]
MTSTAAHPVLAEVVRSGFVEGVHRGSLVVLAADGSVEFACGDPDAVVFPRSSVKPLQAAAVLGCGAELDGELLALAAASHSGETFHLAGVRAILATVGLDEGALRTPAELPLDPVEAEARLRAGGGPDRITMNCSGKHAAMLAACVAAGWPTEGYLDPEHPVQQAVLDEARRATGDPVEYGGTDGCGAPLLRMSLTGLARAFRSCVVAAPESPRRRVADAMRAHPALVAGTRRIDTWLMEGVPGALAKVGAEAVQAVALTDGRALAFKIDDGAARAVGPVLAATLRRLGLTEPVLDRIADSPLFGGGARVGGVRATLPDTVS